MSDLVNATEAASLAVQFDQTGQTDKAVECYRTAARLLDRVCNQVSSEKQIEFRRKVKEYLERATRLQEQKGLLKLAHLSCFHKMEVFLIAYKLDVEQIGFL